MDKQYFDHHVLLVHAVILLNLFSISETTMNKTERTLIEYISPLKTSMVKKVKDITYICYFT